MKRKTWHNGIMVMAAFGLYVLAEISSNAYAAESNPLVGKWGYSVLGHGRPGHWSNWKTEAGTITFNSDGTAAAVYAESADICPDANYCKQSDTSNFTYNINADGTFNLYDIARQRKYYNSIISSDGKMLFFDGTAKIAGVQGLIVGVKLDTTKQYSNADVSGDYYSIAYERDDQGGQRGFNRAESKISTMDGAGNILSNGKLNGDGTIFTITNEAMTYNVNADGTIIVGGVVTGHASPDGNLFVASNPSRFYPQTGNDFAAFFAMKKHDRDYSTSDLSGRWAYTGFGDRSGSVRSEFGTIICDSIGACNLSGSVLHADDRLTFKEKSVSISILSDGSFSGFVLSGAMPQFSGAIGNNGNTMLLTMNDDNTSINDRLIGVAVKINDPSCTLSPANYAFSASVGTGSVTVTASPSSYSWTAASDNDWITISSGNSGTGDGTVTHSVSANTTGSHRTGTITIGGHSVNIRQAKSVFADDPNNVFSPYIYSIYVEGITVGCGSNSYCPNNYVTRGEMAAFIMRAKYGESFTYTSTPYFGDAPSNNVFFKYVQKMKDDAITALTGTYMISNYVTRQEMAAFIIRALYGESFAYNLTPYYTDVLSTSAFFPYVQKMKDAGFTSTTGTYNAMNNVTRGEMAIFVSRAFLGMQ